MTCTCTVEERHLRDLAEPLRQADYHAVLRDDQQLEVSGGDNVPYWEQRSSWLVQCQRADEQSPWQYHYEDGEPLGDVDDKALVLFRLKARIHGIDHMSGDPARRLLVESLRPV